MMSAMALGFSITKSDSVVVVADRPCSSWWGSSSTLIFAFGSGGPVLLVYGFLFMALVAGCVAVSLGELASAYPNSGNARTYRRKIDDSGGHVFCRIRLGILAGPVRSLSLALLPSVSLRPSLA
jgi:amino acid transporter